MPVELTAARSGGEITIIGVHPIADSINLDQLVQVILAVLCSMKNSIERDQVRQATPPGAVSAVFAITAKCHCSNKV